MFEAARLAALGIDVEKIKHSDPDLGEPAWAHVSGWAQLSGTPRRLSCVLLCRDAAPTLAHLLPELSDVLTEIGFPWEVTVIDQASVDESHEVLSQWTEFPGFNWLRLAKDYGDTAAALAGLCSVRGDAVIVTNASASPSIERLPEMVDQWEQGSAAVFLERRGDDVWSAGIRSQEPFDLELHHLTLANSLGGASNIVLLDRRAIDRLVNSTIGR